MKIRINRTRMAMGSADRCYAYGGVVPVEEVERRRQDAASYLISIDGHMYLTFADGTRPAAIDAMPLGMAKYRAVRAHEAEANAILLLLAKAVFPELEPAAKWPELWVSIPDLEATHETRYTEL